MAQREYSYSTTSSCHGHYYAATLLLYYTTTLLLHYSTTPLLYRSTAILHCWATTLLLHYYYYTTTTALLLLHYYYYYYTTTTLLLHYYYTTTILLLVIVIERLMIGGRLLLQAVLTVGNNLPSPVQNSDWKVGCRFRTCCTRFTDTQASTRPLTTHGNAFNGPISMLNSAKLVNTCMESTCR